MRQISLKLESLEAILAGMQSVLVAYSGGADSTFLLKVASDVLGEKAIAVTAHSATYPPRELQEARKNAVKIGIKHIIVKTNEFGDPNFVSNPPNRCYYCKKKLYTKLSELAEHHKVNHVIDGSTCDDEMDFRPGKRAAVEFHVKSPLKDAGFTKEEIRALSRDMGIPTWDKPPLPCLSTRFPYGTHITRENVVRVCCAEEFLADFGIRQLRVRDHGNIARIEVWRQDMPLFLDETISKQIVDKFKSLGYTYITLDLQGYMMGSMNVALKEKK